MTSLAPGGGTAVVYCADDLRSGCRVALKVMHGPDQVPIKVVKREITFSTTVAHDNIVRLLDVFAEAATAGGAAGGGPAAARAPSPPSLSSSGGSKPPQTLVIVWELIEGPDLLDLLNECGGQMPEEQVRSRAHREQHIQCFVCTCSAVLLLSTNDNSVMHDID